MNRKLSLIFTLSVFLLSLNAKSNDLTPSKEVLENFISKIKGTHRVSCNRFTDNRDLNPIWLYSDILRSRLVSLYETTEHEGILSVRGSYGYSIYPGVIYLNADAVDPNYENERVSDYSIVYFSNRLKISYTIHTKKEGFLNDISRKLNFEILYVSKKMLHVKFNSKQKSSDTFYLYKQEAYFDCFFLRD